jgi:hypothetical protein
MTILGFQVVLVDEQGQELERIPDVYPDFSAIVVGDYGYMHLPERDAVEEGQQVRYFQRVPDFHVHKTRELFDRLTEAATSGKATA